MAAWLQFVEEKHPTRKSPNKITAATLIVVALINPLVTFRWVTIGVIELHFAFYQNYLYKSSEDCVGEQTAEYILHGPWSSTLEA
jgi:hypothetical protein